MEVSQAASRARLGRYAAHIRKMAGTYPDFWWIVALADSRRRGASASSRSGGSCCWSVAGFRSRAPLRCGFQGSHERPCILVRQRRQASFAVRDQDRVSSEVIRQRHWTCLSCLGRRSAPRSPEGEKSRGGRECGEKRTRSASSSQSSPRRQRTQPKGAGKEKNPEARAAMASSFATREACSCARRGTPPRLAARGRVVQIFSAQVVWLHTSSGWRRTPVSDTAGDDLSSKDFECGVCCVRGDVSE